MKTIDFLKMVEKKNLCFPKDWAIVQSSSGNMKDILTASESNELKIKQSKIIKEKLMRLIK